jgi:hypothetical protein
MSYNLKITVYNNRDYEQAFIMHDSFGNPIDLTNCKLVFGYGTDSKTLATHASDSAANKCIFVTDAASGAITLKLPYTVLRQLEAGNYFHDLVYLDGDGQRYGIWQGQMTVKRGLA